MTKILWVLILSAWLVVPRVSLAQSNAINSTASSTKSWTNFRPFIPETTDYGFELGSMWEKNSLYWIGGNVGFHVGRCVFSFSQTCQQYTDIIGGVGGRDGLTTGLLLGALRWQFVSAPSPISTSARVFAGAMNIRDNSRDVAALAYGISYGVTTAIHQGLDLKLEVRVGHADQLWTQSFLSFQFKMEKWLDYFANKLKGLSGEGVVGGAVGDAVDATGAVIKGTLKAPGQVIKGTIEAPETVMDWMDTDKKANKDTKSKAKESQRTDGEGQQ